MDSALLVRAGKHGRLVEDFLRSHRVLVGWHRLGDLGKSGPPIREAVLATLLREYPEDRRADGNPKQHAAEIVHLAVEAKPDDLVVTVAPNKGVLVVGRILGPYEYLPDGTSHSPGYYGTPDSDELYRHSLPVRWECAVKRKELPPEALKDVDRIGRSLYWLHADTSRSIQHAAKTDLRQVWPGLPLSPSPEDLAPTADPDELQRRVERIRSLPPLSNPTGCTHPQRVSTVSHWAYQRCAGVAALALDLAQGVCILCGNPAPFTGVDGNPYLEVHHIRWLSQGGPDTPDNTVALCPNCHRRVHHSQEREALQVELAKLKAGETSLQP